MKKFYLILVLLFAQQTFSQYLSAGIGRWHLGVNVGGLCQKADVRHDVYNFGFGATLEYAVYQKQSSFFGFSLRGRFLNGKTTGYNNLLHEGIISNNALNGVSDTSFNYSNAPLFLNNRTKLNEFSLEAMLKWNKLYRNHGILFYLYVGGGFTNYLVETDQKDLSGAPYDYSLLLSSNPSVDEIKNFQDGEFETELVNPGYNTTVFTPSVGVGLGFRLAPGVDFALEHKISLPQTDLFDGQEIDNGDPSFIQDMYHYTSLGLIFSIVHDYEPTTYVPPVDPVTPDPITPITTTPKKPVITLTNPTGTDFYAPNCQVEITAKIENVYNQSDIDFYQNGTKVASYKYFFTPPTFKSTVDLKEGNNSFKIVARSGNFSDTKTFNLSCTDSRTMKVCHKKLDGTFTNLTIKASEWKEHQAHGDLQGDCVAKNITICHNIPGKPGQTQTISIPESDWNIHQSHGDYLGTCAEKKLITICHNNQVITIDEKDWATHAAHGDTKGDCPKQVNMITICHIPESGNKRITMTIPENEWLVHQAHGDYQGTCPATEPMIDICHKQGNTNVNMVIPEFRWNEHFGHGDSKGKCPEASFIICHTNPATGQKENISITESLWASHAAHGDTKGPCPAPVNNITICHNQGNTTVTMTIKESDWPIHAAHGDVKGECPKQENRITICHLPPGNPDNPQTIVIPESAWPAHQAHGDSKGVCPEKMIEICHKQGNVKVNMTIKASEWANHFAHGDTKGACPVEEKKITICHLPPGNANNPQTIEIPESAWPAHAAHGDSKGACPEKQITICHNIPGKPGQTQTLNIPESQWAIHKSHGDQMGACRNTPPVKMITICHHVVDSPIISPAGTTIPSRTMVIPETDWPAHAAHGDTKGACPIKPKDTGGGTPGTGGSSNNKIKICHYPPGNTGNPQTIEIPQSAWPAHAAHGDTQGECTPTTTPGDDPNAQTSKKIKICHIPPGNPGNPQTIEIPESAWPAHEAHGDSKGICQPSNTEPPSNTPGGSTGGNSGDPGNGKMTICHYPPGNKNNPQTIEISVSAWPAHKAHGDTEGACAPATTPGGNTSGGSNKKITICHIPPGNTGNPQTIEIPESAWAAHEAHGDTKGSCQPAANPGGNNGGGNSGGGNNNGGNSGNDKITICHTPPGKNSKPQTIVIPVSEWPTHQAHGDTQGVCGGNAKSGKTTKTSPTKTVRPGGK
ncbi:MAG: hypothetical protein KDD41_01445 [Flavobacteriales bacterium]|nr:hypothetical protein [Flavobacteriales bacterium]